MKKLTAGIFATILGVTAMGAADAAIPSKGYVDTAVKGVADSVSTLGTNVAKDYATKEALASEVTARSEADETLQANINAEAKTRSDADIALGQRIDGIQIPSLNGYATETWVEGKDYATNTALTTGLAGKVDNATLADYAKTADLAGVATTGAYADLTGTPDLSDMATKTEVANTYATKTAINGMATETWVEGKDYATNTALTSGLAGKQANLTDAQLQAVNSGITAAKITTMDQATATAQAAAEAADGKAVAADGKAVAAQAAADAAQADADQALLNAAAAQGVADAAAAALNSATKISDGNYTLTMKVVGDTVSYGWEMIDRGYDSADVTPNNQ